MKNVLVTGGAGFIGANFIRHMLSKYPNIRIFNVDALTYAGDMSNLGNLPDPYRHIFIPGSINNKQLVDDVLAENHIDTVVNFAAETHVDRAIDNPEVFIRTNVIGTLALLEGVRRLWGGRADYRCQRAIFHHVSTDEVYGSLEATETPWTEDSPYMPNSAYSASKAAADHLVRAYGRTHRIPYTITNCSNNYGPRQHPEKLVPMTILNALGDKPIPVYGKGTQVRD
jgi:dTDP-glucose 4,6-dehydratase